MNKQNDQFHKKSLKHNTMKQRKHYPKCDVLHCKLTHHHFQHLSELWRITLQTHHHLHHHLYQWNVSHCFIEIDLETSAITKMQMDDNNIHD